MMRLVLRMAPRTDEWLTTFILRLAEENHCAPTQIARAAGLDCSFVSRPCSLMGLSKAIGGLSAPGALEELAAWPDALGRVRIGEALVDADLVSIIHPRVCVRCIQEGRPVPRLFGLYGVVACPVHECLLTDRCSKCDRRIRWDRPGLLRCACGQQLQPEEKHPSAGALDVARFFIGGALERPEGFAPICGVHQVARLIRFLGAGAFSGTSWRLAMISKPGLDQMVGAVERAASALTDWPHGLHRWLADELGEISDNSPQRLVRLAARVKSTVDVAPEPFVDEIRAALAQLPHGALLRPGTFLAPLAGAQPRFMRANRAARSLQVRGSVVTRLMSRKILCGSSVRRGARSAHLIEAGDVEVAGLRLQSLLTATQVAEALHISRSQVEKLVRHDVIERSQVHRAKLLFEPCEADRLLGRLAAIALPGAPSRPVCLADLASRNSASMAQVLSAILKGDMPVQAAQGSGLFAFAVEAKEVDGLRIATGARRWSVQAAARRLRVSPRMIPVLVAAGCLTADVGKSNGRIRRRAVHGASLQEFERSFVFSGPIARHLGTSTGGVINRMVAAGIKPVVPSDSGRGISAVWRRSDLLRLVGQIKGRS